MRAHGFTETLLCALHRGLAAITLASLLAACAGANEQGTPDGEDPTGLHAAGGAAGGAGPETAGGAAGTSVGDTGGAGTGGTGTGGAYAAGGAPGAGAGGIGAGGDVPVGAGGDVPVGAGGFGPVGTGGSDPVGAGGMQGSGGASNAQVTCHHIANGPSSVTVNGLERHFTVRMPNDTSRMALLFVWHGWMQQGDTFANEIVYDVAARRWVPFDPNAFPMPLMIVTPHDTKLLPPLGLDWDIVTGEKDFPFFEAMLQCIHEQLSIDDSRIYSFGFSAGAVFTNLLSAKYPHLFAATISESGAWFNDQTQWVDVAIPVMPWAWPAFNPADGGNVLLTHGGANDFATVISLESTNRKAIPYLRAAGRTVIDCAHTFGHTLDPDLTQSMYYEYLWAHQRGGPPLGGLPPSFPTPERRLGATTCTFHPAP